MNIIFFLYKKEQQKEGVKQYQYSSKEKGYLMIKVHATWMFSTRKLQRCSKCVYKGWRMESCCYWWWEGG